MDREDDEPRREPGSAPKREGAPEPPADDRAGTGRDEVQEASEESFPASDPPAGSPEPPA